MPHEIGSYAAKTKLAELLRGVQRGERYTITLRGQPVAELIPVEKSKKALREAAVKKLIDCASQRTAVDGLDIKVIVEEGRL